MTRRSYRRRLDIFETRAPRKGTVAIATGLYLLGLLGELNLLAIPKPYTTYALALAGGLLILSAFLHQL